MSKPEVTEFKQIGFPVCSRKFSGTEAVLQKSAIIWQHLQHQTKEKYHLECYSSFNLKMIFKQQSQVIKTNRALHSGQGRSALLVFQTLHWCYNLLLKTLWLKHWSVWSVKQLLLLNSRENEVLNVCFCNTFHQKIQEAINDVIFSQLLQLTRSHMLSLTWWGVTPQEAQIQDGRVSI